MDYITKADLITKFGTSWASDEDFELYADLVNSWLYGRGIPQDVTNPDDITMIRRAAFFLARAAKEDALYVSTDNIKSQKGSAQSGTNFEVEYVAYKNAENRWIKLAKDCLVNFLQSSYVLLINKIN